MKRNEKELLRKQLQLLAEQSKNADDRELPALSSAMARIYEALLRPSLSFRIVLGLAVGLDLLISVLIHIQ